MYYHEKEGAEVLKSFTSDGEKGLSSAETVLRLQKYGFNRLKEVRRVPYILKFLSQFKDLLAIMLMVAAVLALIVGEPRDFIIIMAIVLINATIGFTQEYKAERVLSAFKKHLPSYTRTVRDGELKRIFAFQLVPGDILDLEAGDSIGADARLLEAYDLKVNQFSLTGESHTQRKKTEVISSDKTLADIDNMVFMGTSVASGKGMAVVVQTGMGTQFGKIAEKSQEIKEEMTPLQKELFHTGKVVAKIAIIIALAVLALLYFMGRGIQESLLFAIAAGVAMVPEGLPAAMSVALSLGAQRMLKKKALVKKLLHVESLGSVTTICTDKTGTLTTSVMSVADLYPKLEEMNEEQKDLFLNVLALCNNAGITKKGSKKDVGDPLEIALLKYVERGGEIDKIKKENPRVFEMPFSAERKMMSVVCKKGDQAYLYSKGALQEILGICSVSEKEKARILKEGDEMAKNGLRILAMAYRELGGENYKTEKVEKDLTFLGLTALEDPAREGVAEAISLSRKAHLKIHMVTGDYGLTALSIGKKIGLATEKTKVITGLDLHKVDDEGLKKILQNETIFARIEPGQKLRIVKNLQEMGEVVAVTGDGVNDVPALIKADIGVSMGKIGTDVAKEAADMVLMDDHFATIVNAIREGRKIFDNAKKFVFYVFSSNAGELIAPLIGVLLGLPLPLIAVQILAIDLGTDVFPSLALGVEKEEDDVMQGKPRSRTEKIMSVKMLWRLLEVGIVMGSMGFAIFIFRLYQGGWQWGGQINEMGNLYFSATASVYATLVLCQTANAFSCRSQKYSAFKTGFFSNIWLIWAEVASFIMLAIMMYFPPIQHAFRTAPPTPQTWLLIFAAAIVFFIVQEIIKKIIRQKNTDSGHFDSRTAGGEIPPVQN